MGRECRSVVLSCDSMQRYEMYTEVYRGARTGMCTVLFASPPRCVLTPRTSVRFARGCSYEEQRLKSNVLVVERCGEAVKKYVYPLKTYTELMELYIRPLAEGGGVLNNGVILYGAPGVGKSALARVIARMLGVDPLTVSPDILSKWVGESERNLRETIKEAIEGQPSVVILDDADWLIKPRSLASETEVGGVTRNLQTILFEEMQRVYDEGHAVLFIATTNVKPSEIDPAFLRYGRFGDPLFIPLPDYEAIYIIVKDIVGDEEKAKTLAKKLVNSGASMADAIAAATRLVKTGDPGKIKRGGRGYTRIVLTPHPKAQEVAENLEKQGAITSDMLRGASRIWFRSYVDIASALFTQLASHYNKTVIQIIDDRYIDEAVHMANTLESVIVCPTSISAWAQVYLVNNATVPVIYSGKKPPEVVYTHPIHILSLEEIKRGQAITELLLVSLLELKGINTEARETREAIRKAVAAVQDAQALENLLYFISSTNTFREEMINISVQYSKRPL